MRTLLEGVRVLDSGILLGGSTGMHLADLGADVIKIESPTVGDYLRDFLGQVTPHHSPAFMECNRNKRSVALNLKQERGREVFYELLATADVFIDGFVAGQAEKLGIGYEAQRRAKPDIVYLQFTGFGSNGPYATVPTHGLLMNALAGAIPVAVDERGWVVDAPNEDVWEGTTSGGDASASAAAYAAMYILAALVHRARTGEGCRLDAAGSDAVIAAGHVAAVTNLNFERIADRGQLEGTKLIDPDLTSKYTHYRTKDDRVVLFAGIEHKFWDNFCRAVAREDLLVHKDSSRPADWGLVPGLRQEVSDIFASRTLDEWMDLAVSHDIPMGPTNRITDLLSDAQLRAREILVESEHPGAGPFTFVGSPVMVQGQPFEILRHSPERGQQTEEILGELGYESRQIQELRDSGTI
ncbi:CaiB/BaiF CoA transferase family protein [Pseudonocardia sp.]|uniref:CaiB/BaiF CoA transferase family protein n=1 Tax=Pseudonocardia sp. TaxID=60912 RepID=UPI003D0A3E6C